MNNVSTLPRLRTPGVIARELGESLRRIQYILRTRPHIKPAALAGRLRLYDLRAVAMVRHELNAIAARRLAKQARQRGLNLRTAAEMEQGVPSDE